MQKGLVGFLYIHFVQVGFCYLEFYFQAGMAGVQPKACHSLPDSISETKDEHKDT